MFASRSASLLPQQKLKETIMIMLEAPNIIFNSHDVGPDTYRMTYNVDLRRGVSPSEVARSIVNFNQQALFLYKSPLRNIVFNSHGHFAKVSIGGIGQPGIEPSTVRAFAILKPLNIGTVWFISCDVAKGPIGIALCQVFASVAGTQVIASDEDQETSISDGVRMIFGGSNQIDDFEGTVYSFTPVGGIRRINPQDVWTVKT